MYCLRPQVFCSALCNLELLLFNHDTHAALQFIDSFRVLLRHSLQFLLKLGTALLNGLPSLTLNLTLLLLVVSMQHFHFFADFIGLLVLSLLARDKARLESFSVAREFSKLVLKEFFVAPCFKLGVDDLFLNFIELAGEISELLFVGE